jgi:mono/diheme cytochrome c family protein
MKFSATRWVFGALFYALSTFAAAQQAAATQPFPIGDAVVPQRIDYAPEAAAAPADGAGPRAAVSAPVELVANMDNASTIYDNACNACHGEQGEGGHSGGPDIRNSALSLSQIKLVINAGRNTMPAFAGFTEQELLDISTFVQDAL